MCSCDRPVGSLLKWGSFFRKVDLLAHYMACLQCIKHLFEPQHAVLFNTIFVEHDCFVLQATRKWTKPSWVKQ